MNRPRVVAVNAWPVVLVAMVVLGLVLAIHHVVRDAMRQGELRRELTALHNAAAQRCNALRGRVNRDACLHNLSSSTIDRPLVGDQNGPVLAAPNHSSVDLLSALTEHQRGEAAP